MTRLVKWTNSKRQKDLQYVGCFHDNVRREVSCFASPEEYDELVKRTGVRPSVYTIDEDGVHNYDSHRCFYSRELDTFFVYPVSYSYAFVRWRIKLCAVVKENATCPGKKDTWSAAVE